jgi:transcriptional regulator with XRE-family HTH domain
VGRPPVITPRIETQLAALLDCGVTQERAALAVGVSRRTVQRFAAARRQEPEPQTLEELLAAMPTFEEVLADADRARAHARRSRRASERDWREVARMLEHDAPERWAPPVQD